MTWSDKYRSLPIDEFMGSPVQQWGAVHAWRLGSYWTVPIEVPLHELADLDAVVQSKGRLASVRRARESGGIEPIELGVFRDGSAWIVDGNHRLVDARDAGLPSIPARFTFVGQSTPVPSVAQNPMADRLLTDPPTRMHAWHCGAKPEISTFDDFVDYLGTGEGNVYLGPGIYFATSQHVAERYCKYTRNPTLYEAEIDTSDYYDSVAGRPAHVRDRLVAALAEVGLGWGRSPPDSFRYGRHDIGVLVWKLGRRAALKLLLKHGVRGALDEVHHFWEIAVFDPSTVTVLSTVSRPGLSHEGSDG